MSVNAVNGSQYAAYTPANTPNKAAEDKAVTAQQQSAPVKDYQAEVSFEKSNPLDAVKNDHAKLQELAKSQMDSFRDAQQKALQDMVDKLLSGQMDWSVKGEFSFSFEFSFSQSMSETSAEMDKLAEVLNGSREEAQAALDNYWSVDSVSTRIMDMALSLAGGDNSKLSVLRDAVTAGFEQAGLKWGGELPEISNNTYDETMKRFDYWAEQGSMEGYVYSAEAEESVQAESAAQA